MQKTDEAKEEAEKSEADLAKTDGYEVEGEDVEASDDSQAVSGEQTPPPTLNQEDEYLAWTLGGDLMRCPTPAAEGVAQTESVLDVEAQIKDLEKLVKMRVRFFEPRRRMAERKMVLCQLQVPPTWTGTGLEIS